MPNKHIVGVILFVMFALTLAYREVRGNIQSSGHLDGSQCESCHLAKLSITTENAGKLFNSQEILCTTCHENVLEVSHPSGFSPSRELANNYPLDWKGDLTCSTCHNIHGNNRGLLRIQAFGKEHCLSCHNHDFFNNMVDEGQSLINSAHMAMQENYEDIGLDPYSIQCMTRHEISGNKRLDIVINNQGIMRHSDGKGNHPIGANYQKAYKYGGYRSEQSLAEIIKLPEGKVSCVSCHAGYSQQHGIVISSLDGSSLCYQCHGI